MHAEISVYFVAVNATYSYLRIPMKSTKKTTPTDNPIFQFSLDASLTMLLPLLYDSLVVSFVLLSGVVPVLLLGVSVVSTDKCTKCKLDYCLAFCVLSCSKIACKDICMRFLGMYVKFI